jgi:ABC-type nickel/cobalt efflux system permease component RcnA
MDKHRLPEINLTREAHQHVEPEHGHEQDERDHQRGERGRPNHRRQQREGRECGEPRKRGATAGEADHRTIDARRLAHFLAARPARREQALRPSQQSCQQQHESDPAAKQRRDVTGTELLCHTEEQPARDRAGERLHSADCKRDPNW